MARERRTTQVVRALHLNIYEVTDIQMLRMNDLRSTLRAPW